MFGKGIIKIIGYIILGAIVLAIGAELLSSVVSIVLAFRLGNPVPFLIMTFGTAFLLFAISRLDENTSLYVIANILGYAATGYFIVVVFVMVLPYGLVLSFVSAGISGVFCSFIRDPMQVNQYIRKVVSDIHVSGVFDGLKTRNVEVGYGYSFTLNTSCTLSIVEEGSRDRLFQLMRERPLLPISYTHYVDCDVLFIEESSSRSKNDSILKLLSDYGIATRRITSLLLIEAIQLVPILDSRHGLKIDDYRITNDESTITNLLNLSPPRLTIFPTTQGLCALIPELDAPGLNIEPIRRGHEHEVILHRNFINAWEVEKQIETTT